MPKILADLECQTKKPGIALKGMGATEDFWQDVVGMITGFKKANQPAHRIRKRGKMASGDYLFILVLTNFNCICHKHAVIMQ